MLRSSKTAVAALLAPILAPTQLLAAPRIWISAARGVDSATCGSAQSPCRSLAQAHANVDADGEIDVLDPGGYGSLIVTKSVRIINDGVGTAGALATVPGGIAIGINAAPTDKVVIRGFSFEGGGTGNYGVVAYTAASVLLENTLFSGFTKGGFAALPTTADMDVTIVGATVSNTADVGIGFAPAGTVSVSAHLKNIVAVGNTNQNLHFYGAGTTGKVVAEVTDSLLEGSVENIRLTANAAATGDNTIVAIRNTVMSKASSVALLLLNANASASLSRTVINNNLNGVCNQAGTLFTYKDNHIHDNGHNIEPGCTALTPLFYE